MPKRKTPKYSDDPWLEALLCNPETKAILDTMVDIDEAGGDLEAYIDSLPPEMAARVQRPAPDSWTEELIRGMFDVPGFEFSELQMKQAKRDLKPLTDAYFRHADE